MTRWNRGEMVRVVNSDHELAGKVGTIGWGSYSEGSALVYFPNTGRLVELWDEEIVKTSRFEESVRNINSDKND